MDASSGSNYPDSHDVSPLGGVKIEASLNFKREAIFMLVLLAGPLLLVLLWALLMPLLRWLAN